MSFDRFQKLEENKRTANFTKRDIFYNIDKEQILRFVGDYLPSRTHWIGASQFNPFEIFQPGAFEGEDKLSNQIICSNWDIENEKYNPNGGCIICKLRSIADDIMRNSKSLGIDEKGVAEFKDLRYKCDYRQQYTFNIIDRQNPDGGFKIVKVSKELMGELNSIHESYQPADFAGIEDGVDIKVVKAGGGGQGRVTFKASLILQGAKVKITPLTEEEKAWQTLDLKKFAGKMPDQAAILSKLLPRFRDLIDANAGTATTPPKEDAGKAPF